MVQLSDHYVASELRAGRLASVLGGYCAPDDGVWAIYPQNRHLSPRARLRLDHLEKDLR
ncbi:hypothetical protein [Sulfitobacter dubius]|uniref:hypothetical protein n=1 Tax=Sulfitobacter dubius TaxID=218673 RepID=UPI0030D8E5F0